MKGNNGNSNNSTRREHGKELSLDRWDGIGKAVPINFKVTIWKRFFGCDKKWMCDGVF